MKTIFILGAFLLAVSSKAEAFDRLSCESDLKDWNLIYISPNSERNIQIKKDSFLLTETQSKKMIVSDASRNIQMTIFPWNSLYVRKSPKFKKSHETLINETSSSFSIETLDKKTNLKRYLNCRFTF